MKAALAIFEDVFPTSSKHWLITARILLTTMRTVLSESKPPGQHLPTHYVTRLQRKRKMLFLNAHSKTSLLLCATNKCWGSNEEIAL